MLRIRVLGELEVDRDGARVDLAGRATGSLLAWLAVHPGTHDRLRVASVFWPDASESAARNNLRQAVWALRQALGDDPPVHSTRTEVGMRAGDGVVVDLWSQHALLAAGDIEGALALGRTLLPDHYDDWVEAARIEHQQDLRAAVARAAADAERTSDLERAVVLTEHLVAFDPFSEHAHRDLMRRLAAGGDRGKALVVYDRLCTRLQDELGVDPTAETVALADRLRDTAAFEGGADQHSPAARGAPRFVARADELAALRAAWGDAKAGQARCVVVGGEPGVGKTRLVHELARHASGDGGLVLFGRATEEALVPYQPWVEALRRCVLSLPEDVLRAVMTADVAELELLVPEVTRRGAGVTPTGGAEPSIMSDRFRLFEAAVGFTRNLARRLPLVLVLDDLHWADPASLLLLRHFLESVVADPVLVVVTFRDTEPRRAELEAVLAEVRAQRITRLSLGGLDEAGAGALLTDDLQAGPSDELVAVLHRRTGGNPLFLLEVGRSLTESGALAHRDGQWVWALDDVSVVIPEAVAQVIERRVDHLGSDARRVLEAGATAGFEFAADVVAHVTRLSQPALLDVLDAATRARLVDELEHEPGHYRFGHPLVWDVLYHGLTHNRRALLHEQVGVALTAIRDPNDADVVSQLAFHFLRAPQAPRDRTIAHALEAVDLALRRRAFEEALDLCDAAAALVPEKDSDLRRALVSRKGLAFAAAWVETYHPGRNAVADATYEPAPQEK